MENKEKGLYGDILWSCGDIASRIGLIAKYENEYGLSNYNANCHKKAIERSMEELVYLYEYMKKEGFFNELDEK